LKKLYIIYILFTTSLSAQVFPSNKIEDFGDIFRFYDSKNDSVWLVFNSSVKKDSFYISPAKLKIKLLEYHRQLIDEGKIYNQIKLKEVENSSRGRIYIFDVSEDEIQQINRFVFIGPKKKFPLNLKRILKKKFENSPLSKKQMREMANYSHKLSPSIEIEKISPVILKNQNGVKIYYRTFFKNFIEGELSNLYINNKSRFQAYLNLQTENLFNQAEETRLYWKKNGDSQEFNAGMFFPYIGGSSFYGKGYIHLNQFPEGNLSKDFRLETGLTKAPFRAGIAYQYIYKENESRSSLAGITLSWKKRTKDLDKFLINKSVTVEFLQKTGEKTNGVFLMNISYPFALVKNHRLLFSSLLMKNTRAGFTFPLNHLFLKDPLYLPETDYAQLKFFNLKAFMIQTGSIYYLTASYLDAKNIYPYTRFESGIGLLNAGKNQLLNLEFVYTVLKQESLYERGFRIKINQKIKL